MLYILFFYITVKHVAERSIKLAKSVINKHRVWYSSVFMTIFPYISCTSWYSISVYSRWTVQASASVNDLLLKKASYLKIQTDFSRSTDEWKCPSFIRFYTCLIQTVFCLWNIFISFIDNGQKAHPVPFNTFYYH